jgi:soluble lytic murein transglycosylase-like protein
MQVNLLHHSKAFRNLEEAFTPKNNINYAAKYFTELKRALNSWTYAVGYYHSKSSRYNKPYCHLVYNAWKKVLDNKVHTSLRVCRAASEVKSQISFFPSYYGFADKKLSAKLHKLGRQSIARGVPKFFAKRR